jgi:hypothetical protein
MTVTNSAVGERPVRRGWVIFWLCAVVALAILVNALPTGDGQIHLVGRTFAYDSWLTPGLRSLLPWVNLSWGLQFGLGVALLVWRRRTLATRCVDLVSRLYGAALLGRMAQNVSSFVEPQGMGTVRALLWLGCVAAVLGMVHAVRKFSLQPAILQWDGAEHCGWDGTAD